MDITLGATAPALSARYQLKLHDTFGAQVNGHLAAQVLRGKRHEYTIAALQRGQHFGPLHYLLKMGRTNFFFAFGHEDQIDGKLLACAPDGMKRSQESCFW